MNVVPLLVLVSLMLVAGSLLMFGHSMVKKDHQHADRLSLLPVVDDETRTTNPKDPRKAP
jgi:hypothetical protein